MQREFHAPGPGTWTLDTTHSATAMTNYSAECFEGLAKGFKECCERYGLLMSHVQPHFLHGFFFTQQVGLVGKPGGSPPPDFVLKIMSRIHPLMRKRIATAHEAFTSRLWLKDLQIWDEMKPDSIARNTKLQEVDLDKLDTAGMVAHLKACRENAEEMVYRHHKFTVGSILPMGRYIEVATRGSGLTAAEVIPLLLGSTPVSTGVAGEQLQVLADAIRAAGISKESLVVPEASLQTLRSHAEINSALDDYLNVCGFMLIGGYCISEKTLNESPNIILARIHDALTPRQATQYDEKLEQQVRSKIPDEDQEEFDLALDDARTVNRMRDERGVYNDIWGSGVARTAILGAGRQLVATGVLSNPELLLDASHLEMMALLEGNADIDEAVLADRREWRLTKDIDEVPEFLGPAPAPPPSLDLLPPKIRPTMRAFIAVMGNVFDVPREEEPETISGLPVSPGVYEGIAKVILSTRDFDRLDEGDVLITKNTSAGFNVVLPIIGALVTDRGGILSHAAIVSREFGIPGVVGTKVATQQIKDGSRVRVDGDSGEVTVV